MGGYNYCFHLVFEALTSLTLNNCMGVPLTLGRFWGEYAVSNDPETPLAAQGMYLFPLALGLDLLGWRYTCI